MKHLISFANWSPGDILACLDLASKIKANPSDYRSYMANRTLAMLFQKTSTRTRASFAAGMHQLGGNYVELDWNQSNFTIGSVADETQCLARYTDLIMARLIRHEDVSEMASVSRVPVINGCCHRYHPCQVLGDLLTIYENFKRFEGIRLAYVGVLNNVANSILEVCPDLGMELTLVSPETREDAIDEETLEKAIRSGKCHRSLELREVVKNVDIVYTDTWIDMEFYLDPSHQQEKQRRTELFMPYQINMELLAGTNAVVMHCLAAHRGFEITGEVLESDRSIAFDQAENRMHAQKAAMIACLEA